MTDALRRAQKEYNKESDVAKGPYKDVVRKNGGGKRKKHIPYVKLHFEDNMEG